MSAVLGGVDTATNGLLSGAAGEMGRRSSEALALLVRRMRRGDDGAGDPAAGDPAAGDPARDDPSGDPTAGNDPSGDGPDGAAPGSPGERRELAARLLDHARREPGFARELGLWLRETAWLAPAPPAVAPGASRPQMLPPGTAAFTDRDRVRAEITALLDAPPAGPAHQGASTVVLLVGPGGIGKTAFAVHCAHALAERFPAGQLHADLRGASAATALDPSGTLVRFLHHLGVPADRVPPGADAQADAYRDVTAGRPLTVVLDNAHSAAQVRPLLPAGPGALTLVTSRYRLPELVRDYGAHVLTLGPLSPADSERLLTRVAGAARARGHRSRVSAVAARLGGSPLAICETGSRVAVREHLSWETLERQFAARASTATGEASGVAEGSGGPEGAGDDADAVGLSTDLSYRELGTAAARLYRLLAVWPWPDIGIAAAARTADLPEAEVRPLLEELAGVHLLEEVAEERYRFHDAVRQHAHQRARAEDGHREMAAAVRRTATWYLRFAAAADYRVIPGRWRLGPAFTQLSAAGTPPDGDARAALAELRRERENLAEAVRAAAEYDFDELVWQLCEAMWALHLRLGFHEQWVSTHLRGVAAARRCAQEFGDRRAEGRMLCQLAFGYLGLGLDRSAEAETALTEAAAADEAAGHHRGRATAVESLGLLRLSQWRYTEAEACFLEARQALAAIRPGEDGARDVPRATALLAHHLGRAQRGQRRYPEALAQLHTALALFRELPERDAYNEARVRMSLGETQLNAGDPTAARDVLDQALDTMAHEGAVLQQADAAELSAHCARALHDPADEARRLRRARRHYARSGADGAVARITARLDELDGLDEPDGPDGPGGA